MKMKPDTSKMRKLGERTIDVLEYGGQRTKKIKRVVYSKTTLTKGHPTYWFELVNGIWKNTTKKGIKSGIVITKHEFEKLQEMKKASVKKPASLKKEALAYLKKHGYTGLISEEFLAKKEKLGVTLSELKTSHLDLIIEDEKEAKTKEKERKQKDIIGKQDRAIAKEKKTKTITTTQNEERQSQRTKRARTMDSKKRSKQVVESDRYYLWLKHPNRYDINRYIVGGDING